MDHLSIQLLVEQDCQKSFIFGSAATGIGKTRSMIAGLLLYWM